MQTRSTAVAVRVADPSSEFSSLDRRCLLQAGKEADTLQAGRGRKLSSRVATVISRP